MSSSADTEVAPLPPPSSSTDHQHEEEEEEQEQEQEQEDIEEQAISNSHSKAVKRPRSAPSGSSSSSGHAGHGGDEFHVNKFLQVLNFGDFDDFLQNKGKGIPPTYSPMQVSSIVPDSVWPLRWCSRRKFFSFNGFGAMRNYICTVNPDEEHPGRVLFKIHVEDDPAEVTVASSPEELIDAFRARFIKLSLNSVHASWIKSTEVFFGLNNPVVQKHVHALPGHEQVFHLLKPLRKTVKIVAPKGTEDTDGEDGKDCDSNNGDDEDGDEEEDNEQYPQDYSRLTEIRAQLLLKEKEAEKITLMNMVEKATKVLQRLREANDEWTQLEQKRVCRALNCFTDQTKEDVASVPS